VTKRNGVFFMSHDDDELITKKETCRILGGNEKPLDPSTLYRGIKLERFPPPKHPSPGLSRWSKREVLATRRRIIEGDS
jgi:predicted DNA-binding transcriptional regulator AlpA